MTKKEAMELVQSDKNWTLLEETDHMRLYRLTYKDITFWRLDTKTFCNAVRVLYFDRDEEPRDDFRVNQYFEDYQGLIYVDIRPTAMAEQIWKASKA